MTTSFLPKAVCWGGCAMLGGCVGYWLAAFGAFDVHTAILTGIGVIGTTAAAGFWAALRKLDELKNAPGLDNYRREKLRHRVEQRRGPLYRRWIGAMFFGTLAALAGQCLKAPSLSAHLDAFMVIGYGSATLLFLSTALVFVDYTALSRLGPALSEELRDLVQKQEFREKLRA